MREWQSVHLFVADAQDLDALALEAASAVAAGGADPDDWFFIRYTEGGVHLRLRVGPRAGAGFLAIRARAADACRSLAEGRAPSLWAEAASYLDDDGKLFKPGEAVDVPYVPETVRYGGPDGLHLNERLFRYSTAIAVALVKATREDQARRAATSSDLMLMTIAAMLGEDEDPHQFLSHYAASWREMWKRFHVARLSKRRPYTDLWPRYERHVRTARGSGEPTNGIDAWGREVAGARRELERMHQEGRLIYPSTGLKTVNGAELRETLRSLTHSQIHMMNNRLGLWPTAEIVAAEQLVQSLKPR